MEPRSWPITHAICGLHGQRDRSDARLCHLPLWWCCGVWVSRRREPRRVYGRGDPLGRGLTAFWGLSAFLWGWSLPRSCLALAQLRIPSGVRQFRAPAPLAHQRGDLRLWRHAPDHDGVLCGPADLGRAPVWRRSCEFRLLGWQTVILLAATSMCLAAARARNTPSRHGTSTCDHGVWVGFLVVFAGTIMKRRNPTSTWRTGSTCR